MPFRNITNSLLFPVPWEQGIHYNILNLQHKKTKKLLEWHQILIFSVPREIRDHRVSGTIGDDDALTAMQ